MGVKEALSRIRKAIAVAVAGVVVVALKQVGVEIDASTVEVLVTFALTSVVVWAVPNAKEYVDA